MFCWNHFEKQTVEKFEFRIFMINFLRPLHKMKIKSGFHIQLSRKKFTELVQFKHKLIFLSRSFVSSHIEWVTAIQNHFLCANYTVNVANCVLIKFYESSELRRKPVPYVGWTGVFFSSLVFWFRKTWNVFKRRKNE